MSYRLAWKWELKQLKEYQYLWTYEDVKLNVGIGADILVENNTIIEIKSIERLAQYIFYK